ncbi:HAD family hydrolase [Bosea sp. 124]|uniref:D-glycero-alpha-D-manno-heptose-1,7-bisphosphate 7-phosphatase n=1 Tax=Bosea sp. 124 TaxID=2135642 RepID=UPI000D36F000|nr:HAD family hydrolase [Bosea sp. 124]PTM40316.1 D-alpha,beta-D-heptose 1,7-bisphosphate phosphatase [Bosea sp. 124]
MTGVPAVFLDRDGVIVVPEFRDGRSYAPVNIEGFALYPQIAPSLQALKAEGFRIVVVTNQPDVGKGLISPTVLAEMHRLMCEALPIDEVKVCTHTRDDACDCRKPRAGMLFAAAHENGLSLLDSYMVGDRDSDIEAGKEAGCRTVFIDLSYTSEPKPLDPDWVVSSLQEAANVILADKQKRNARCPPSTP